MPSVLPVLLPLAAVWGVAGLRIDVRADDPSVPTHVPPALAASGLLVYMPEDVGLGNRLRSLAGAGLSAAAAGLGRVALSWSLSQVCPAAPADLFEPVCGGSSSGSGPSKANCTEPILWDTQALLYDMAAAGQLQEEHVNGLTVAYSVAQPRFTPLSAWAAACGRQAGNSSTAQRHSDSAPVRPAFPALCHTTARTPLVPPHLTCTSYLAQSAAYYGAALRPRAAIRSAARALLALLGGGVPARQRRPPPSPLPFLAAHIRKHDPRFDYPVVPAPGGIRVFGDAEYAPIATYVHALAAAAAAQPDVLIYLSTNDCRPDSDRSSVWAMLQAHHALRGRIVRAKDVAAGVWGAAAAAGIDAGLATGWTAECQPGSSRAPPSSAAALTDMLVLSRAELVIGSYFSSFSEISTLLHKVDLREDPSSAVGDAADVAAPRPRPPPLLAVVYTYLVRSVDPYGEHAPVTCGVPSYARAFQSTHAKRAAAGGDPAAAGLPPTLAGLNEPAPAASPLTSGGQLLPPPLTLLAGLDTRAITTEIQGGDNGGIKLEDCAIASAASGSAEAAVAGAPPGIGWYRAKWGLANAPVYCGVDVW